MNPRPLGPQPSALSPELRAHGKRRRSDENPDLTRFFGWGGLNASGELRARPSAVKHPFRRNRCREDTTLGRGLHPSHVDGNRGTSWLITRAHGVPDGPGVMKLWVPAVSHDAVQLTQEGPDHQAAFSPRGNGLMRQAARATGTDHHAAPLYVCLRRVHGHRWSRGTTAAARRLGHGTRSDRVRSPTAHPPGRTSSHHSARRGLRVVVMEASTDGDHA